MRKFFYASIILLLFATAIAVTEISCQKTIAQSNNNNNENSSGTILISKIEGYINVSYTTNTDTSTETHTQTYAPEDYFIANIDGTDLKQIPINLPGNLYVSNGGKLSDDGKTIVFYAADIPNYELTNASNYPRYIYSCSVDGSNVKKIYDAGYELNDVH